MTQQPISDENLLRQMAADADENVRRGVAENPATPKELLRQLATDDDKWVRYSVAENQSTPEDVLHKLAEDAELVCAGLAKNPAAPEYLLSQLAKHIFTFVRINVAENAATAVDSLRQLSVDINEWVRCGIAQNPSSPLDAVLYCLPCLGVHRDERADEIQVAFDTHQDKLLSLARSGSLDFDMVCAGGETLKEGLISGGQIEIYNVLLAEQLAGKAERLANNIDSLQPVFSRRI